MIKKLKKGDRVVVLSGKDRGKDGTIMRVLPDKGKLIVEGVNVAKKHQRPTRATMQGGIIDKDMPLNASNVALWCNSCKRGVRVGFRFDAAGKKVRICRKCGGDI
jgi:large subunit ribosomal protein L24